LLAHVRRNARVAWVYPMVVFAAHTGARQSEVVRARIAEFTAEAIFDRVALTGDMATPAKIPPACPCSTGGRSSY
jgi:integrase